ncbi:MAG: hypothetical protein Fur0025_31610 [Oscillatoriaceae cyanobacterium]
MLLLAALPTLQSIARAARSVEKLADTLAREFPPTLEAIRLTGMEISDLTDDVSEGVQSASQVVKQVDRTIGSAKKQTKKAIVTTSSILTGIKAGWRVLQGKTPGRGEGVKGRRGDQGLPASQRKSLELRDRANSEPSHYPALEETSPDSPESGLIRSETPPMFPPDVGGIHQLPPSNSTSDSPAIPPDFPHPS